MVFAVLSRDPDFVQDVGVLLRNAGAEVFAAGSWEEYARLQEEGVVVEMAVVDPVFRYPLVLRRPECPLP